MIKILLTLISVGIYSVSFGQNLTERMMTPIITPTNIERYGIDYEIKNYLFNPSDSALINSIDLQALESYREQFQEIEAVDTVTGLIVILYFEKKSRITNPSIIQEQ